MAFKLTKSQVVKINALASLLESQADEVKGAISSYNETLANSRSLLEDVACELDSEFENKSERWQEGERGEAVRAWIDLFEETCNDLEDLEMPEFSHSEALTGLPEEAEE